MHLDTSQQHATSVSLTTANQMLDVRLHSALGAFK
jgi:hypothetical protein